MSTYPKRWKALSYLTAGAFLSPLDYFIVNMALPSIKKAFSASDHQLQMVVAVYGLTYAALVVCGGRLGDVYGRKKIFILGLYLFLLSSLACAFSPDITFLIIARLFQGVGASLLAPQVLASIRILFSSTEQPKAVSIFSSVFGLASVVGQLMGGFLLHLHWTKFSWEMVFLVNVPVTLICILGIHFTMDNKSEEKSQKIDFVGAFLLIISLLMLICPVIFGRKYHWAWWIFAVLTGGILLLIIFYKYEVNSLYKNRPVLIDPTLLQHQPFVLSLCIIFFYNFTSGLFICYPYYLQQFLHQNPVETGLAIIPYGIAFFLGPLLVPRIKHSAHTMIYLGLALLIAGFSFTAIFFYFHEKPSFLTNISLFLAGLGHGIIMPVMMRESISFISKKRAGQASGLISISIQIGSVTGGTLLGTLFFSTIEFWGFPKAFAVTLLMTALFQMTGIFINKKLLKYSKPYQE
ncbi:EmrB/QacA subfamily drug resistance transporter [Chryseobacterium sp. 52]|uniref:MFS transporter n=1 Tax=Chryseobacterium sp. 52 TaxID=2035213 RepID=UPI000C1990ED|nr:MFS transporter [Chryseobacterium sp. 52]PIF45441.1 EmrB/QacA subfamily drug resistance transporter [Chryseobacterium sp. 52]